MSRENRPSLPFPRDSAPLSGTLRLGVGWPPFICVLCEPVSSPDSSFKMTYVLSFVWMGEWNRYSKTRSLPELRWEVVFSALPFNSWRLD